VFLALAVQLDAVCRLTVMFLSNVNVSGYSVTANVHSKVDALLAVTSQHVLMLLQHKLVDTARLTKSAIIQYILYAVPQGLFWCRCTILILFLLTYHVHYELRNM